MTLGHAIQTRYAGHHFRSRLEARWAVFFDELGVRWLYEPEAYVLPSGSYLPDFGLPEVNRTGVWFEVKPVRHVEAKYTGSGSDPRWSELAELTSTDVFVAFGLPEVSDWGSWDVEGLFHGDDWGPGWDNCQEFCCCFTCGRVGIQFEGRWQRICHHDSQDDGRREWWAGRDQRSQEDHLARDPVTAALTTAHSYRFDPKGRR